MKGRKSHQEDPTLSNTEEWQNKQQLEEKKKTHLNKQFLILNLKLPPKYDNLKQ